MVTAEGRDLGADAAPLSLLAQVLAPGPGCDGDAHGIGSRIEPHLAVAEEDQRTEVALVEVIAAQRLHAGLLDGLTGVGNLEQVDVRRLVEATDVFAQAEHGGAAVLGRVAADALEDAQPVVERVREDVDVGVRPGDEVAIEPYGLSGYGGHDSGSGSAAPRTPLPLALHCPSRARRRVHWRRNSLPMNPFERSRRMLIRRSSRSASTHSGWIWTARVNIFSDTSARPITLYRRPMNR